MVGVQTIGGVPEPAKTKPVNVYGAKQAERNAARRDDLSISQDAHAAARLAELARALPDVREEAVARAKQRLERGLHRVQDVVRQVASRITRYVVL